MALDCNTAFGRYLRILRKRRGLSLDEVESLSRSSPDPINKGYLSRCENGRQRIAFGKIIVLARLYEVPTEVLSERLELDMELDRIGGPNTEGKSYAELLSLGKQSYYAGQVWIAYGYFRDSVFASNEGPVLPTYRDRAEQALVACMNTCSAALHLGRSKFPCHELHYIHQTRRLGPSFSCLILERLGRAYRELRQFATAKQYLDMAIRVGEESSITEWLGFLYDSRAKLAEEESDAELASRLYLKAYRALRDSHRDHECAIALYHLAQAYFAMKRVSSAKRALFAAERVARSHQMERTLAFLRILLGEIEETENRSEQAAAHWREAASMGKKNHDRLLRFKAEVLLYRQALRSGNSAPARAIERRLRKLSPWIPEGAPEFLEFKQLMAGNRAPSTRRVAATQPAVSPDSNA
jgi:tetratricopeptide (TPR) repeat protein